MYIIPVVPEDNPLRQQKVVLLLPVVSYGRLKCTYVGMEVKAISALESGLIRQVVFECKGLIRDHCNTLPYSEPLK